MPRRPSHGEKGFIWLPRENHIEWKLEINSQDVTTDVMSSSFQKGILPNSGEFQVTLINANGEYNSVFAQKNDVKLYADFTTGTTLIFYGKIESIDGQYSNSYNIIISGAHITFELSGIFATEKYTGDKDFDSILNEIENKYLDGKGFTIDNQSSYTGSPEGGYQDIDLLSLISDLCKKASADCRIKEDKTIYIFDKESLKCTGDAIVWNDTLISVSGLGEQVVTVKNKIKVQGDDGTGLPILYTAQDLTSISDYGLKEFPIINKKIYSEAVAIAIGDTEITEEGLPSLEGNCETLFLPIVNPGEMIWITNPPLKIHGQYKLNTISYHLPNERCECSINKLREASDVFRKINEQNAGNLELVNEYRMTNSWNLTFDSDSELTSKESNVTLSQGKIYLSSGTQGIFTATRSLPNGINECQLKVVGENTLTSLFEVSTDGGGTYTTLTQNELFILTTGDTIILRVTLAGANVNIDSLAILYKEV